MSDSSPFPAELDHRTLSQHDELHVSQYAVERGQWRFIRSNEAVVTDINKSGMTAEVKYICDGEVATEEELVSHTGLVLRSNENEAFYLHFPTPQSVASVRYEKLLGALEQVSFDEFSVEAMEQVLGTIEAVAPNAVTRL
jgi:hypothetical protein